MPGLDPGIPDLVNGVGMAGSHPAKTHSGHGRSLQELVEGAGQGLQLCPGLYAKPLRRATDDWPPGRKHSNLSQKG